MNKVRTYSLVLLVLLLISVSATTGYGSTPVSSSIAGSYFVTYVSTGTINQ